MAPVETPMSVRIRWGRVIGFALALEAVLFATLLPLQAVLSLRTWFVAVAIGCAVFAYAAGREQVNHHVDSRRDNANEYSVHDGA